MLKAWIAHNPDDGTAVIVFKKTKAEVIEECGLDSSDEELERAEYFDDYAERGFVPVIDLVKEFGWWYKCAYCNEYITLDDSDCDPEKIKGNDHQIFCDVNCQKKHSQSNL